MQKQMFIVLSVLFLSTIFFLPKANAQSSFTDVTNNDWAASEIDFLTGKNIIFGYSNGEFKPNASITRLQAVFMILREKGITDFSNVSDPGFADVRPGDYSYNEIAKAVELGMISGLTNANEQKIFNPYGRLTRAQMAKILALGYNLEGASEISFIDVPADHWSYDYVQGLAKNKITFGYTDGRFGAADTITRAQFSVMMARVLNPSFRTTTGYNDLPLDEQAPITGDVSLIEDVPGETAPDGLLLMD